MSEAVSRRPAPPPGGARRAVAVSQESLVVSEPLVAGESLPRAVRPTVPGVSLGSWAEANRPWIDRELQKHGGLLFRGFDIPAVGDFDQAVRSISGDLLEYRERSSPRHAVAGKIYTSTDYPPDQPIFLHNENSYQKTWPMRIFFFCHVEPADRGETPIADTRKVFARLDPAVRAKFAGLGWMYVRNFGDGFGLDWQTVFQTDDRARVEEHCRVSGIEVEWKSDGRLRTRAVRRAWAKHPTTGEPVWFNHATFFHISTLTAGVREALLEEFAEEDLPANTYYGDGSPIEPEVLDHLRAAYDAETIRFPWCRGDLLMLDNMMVAHGRAPYSGARQILVGMSHPCTWDEIAA
jgi:alpha-ketoglutarate-dependent taurine dioxygenase